MSAWQDWIGKSNTVEAQLDTDQANHMAVTLDRDSMFRAGDVMPPVSLPRRMWAGGSFTFYSPLRLGETVQKTSTIRSIEPKEGRSGPLCFITVEHALSTASVTNLVETQTIVYREMSRDPELPKAAPAPSGAEIAQQYSLDSTALFRYSALTFNGHRIHYDADYCRAVEGYPNLVIHGPLIATLLLDLYGRLGKPLHTFRYRAKNPLFLPHPFTVNARSEGSSTKLWASDHASGLAMEAEASAG
jgi:3-methylfumaryl-CoA hydratase